MGVSLTGTDRKLVKDAFKADAISAGGRPTVPGNTFPCPGPGALLMPEVSGMMLGKQPRLSDTASLR